MWKLDRLFGHCGMEGGANICISYVAIAVESKNNRYIADNSVAS